MDRRTIAVALAFLLLPLILVSTAAAQLEPPGTGGVVALDHELRMLGHYERVLMIGAHPDDEDTELLTILTRGHGAEAAYLALNRGEGGQNLIGPELGQALGLIRTEELLAARRVDGARQYFTRAYDFGFSKTLADTWAHWPRDSVLKDVVRIIRRFRPQVVVSVFSGTPRDGHGQHQAAGWAAMEAYRIAGDSTRFPELAAEEGLTPWTPLKLYRSTRFDTGATTLTLDGGVLDPVVGQSFHQIAMASRSRHRSQDMGRLQEPGPSTVRVALIDDRSGKGRDGLFAGVDTTLAGVPGPELTDAERRSVRALTARFAARVDSLRAARDHYTAPGFLALAVRASADLEAAEAVHSAALARTPCPAGTICQRRRAYTLEWQEQLAHLARVRAAAAGRVLDAVAQEERIVAGDTVAIALSVWNASGRAESLDVVLEPQDGWAGPGRVAYETAVAPGAIDTRRVGVAASPEAQPTVPYFLRQPRTGWMYSWPADRTRVWGDPFEPPPLVLAATPSGETGAVAGPTREVTSRTNDQSTGEVRRPLVLVPRVDVKIDPDTQVWAAGGSAPRRFVVSLAHAGEAATTGRVQLELPAGWPAAAPQSFTLSRPDERRDFVFEVRPPAGLAAGAYDVRAVAVDAGGRRYTTGRFTVDYPHIRPRSWMSPAASRVVVAPLALPKLTRVGYVRGAADRVPEALRSVGVPIELLDGAMLERGDLARYDAIVIGPRAYETVPALVAHNDRLLAYARAGGLVLVQYQQYQFVRGGFAPFPLTIATPHDRVTDETAAVTALVPGAPALTTPNRIGPADWDGWVQERSLYMPHTWDPAYRPLLEMHDPDEPPQQGALLVAPLGKGTYVYTGLSFFRQLPAGVPGAFRLFLNLLALKPGAVP